MAEHTPGPWRVLSAAPNHSLTINSARGQYIGLAGLQDNGAHEANARLIAAAPELLAALELLRDQAVERGQLVISPGSGPMHVICRAIAKAL